MIDSVDAPGFSTVPRGVGLGERVGARVGTRAYSGKRQRP